MEAQDVKDVARKTKTKHAARTAREIRAQKWSAPDRAAACYEIDQVLAKWSARWPMAERRDLVALLTTWIRWLRSAVDPSEPIACECGSEAAEEINIGRSRWRVCRKHAVRWYIGEDLSSVWWESETDEAIIHRSAMLREYRDLLPNTESAATIENLGRILRESRRAR